MALKRKCKELGATDEQMGGLPVPRRLSASS